MKIWELDPNEFGDQLRDIRLDKQMSQIDLGKRSGCPVSRIGTAERGCSTPDLAQLVSIARVFGIDEIRIDTSRPYKIKPWLKYRKSR